MSLYMLELYQYNIFPLCFYVISSLVKQCKALVPTILHWDIPSKFNDCPNNLILDHFLHWSPCFFSLSLSEIIPQGFFDLSSLKFLKNIGQSFCKMLLNWSLSDVPLWSDYSMHFWQEYHRRDSVSPLHVSLWLSWGYWLWSLSQGYVLALYSVTLLFPVL